MSDLVSKKSYRQIVKGLDFYRQQDDEDRKENPQRIPIGWRNPIVAMIERTVRENHERCSRDLANEVIKYLITKNLLVDYAGDVTFPNRPIPTEEQIKKQILDIVNNQLL